LTKFEHTARTGPGSRAVFYQPRIETGDLFMKSVRGRAFGAALLLASGLMAGTASAATCLGNCGVLGADGDIATPPNGSTYRYVTTDGGVNGAGQIAGVGGVDGSQYSTSAFAADAGDSLEFFFNYVTSDGSQFADYGWAELRDTAAAHVAWLFTGRTQPNGNISPGFGLPANDSVLTPATSAIIDGASNWSPLGGDTGQCFSGVGQGCGNTGWIKSLFNIATAGTYVLVFGTSNFLDANFDSGLAFNGIKLDGVIIDPVSQVPVPAALPLFASAVAGAGWLSRKRRKNKAVAA
jgi:hypothetical protein